MSIIKKRFSFAAAVFAGILLSATGLNAQPDIEASIKIASPVALKIQGKFVKENPGRMDTNWSFRQSIAGVENLSARVSEFNLSDEQNLPISYKKLADGEYLADNSAGNFSYQVNVEPAANLAAMAHASWIRDEQGILMLGDLLPQTAAGNQTISARIKFDLPSDWQVLTGEKKIGENVFDIENIERAVFSVGKKWRREKIQVGQASINLSVSGEWRFSDADAAKMADEVTEEYRKLFGGTPTGTIQISLARAPQATKFGRWAGETRGANTTIVSADMPFKSQSLQLLHEQLRHELFHLWMPNSLALTGDYDWFYEGFAIYQALRTGVSTNQIRFEDFLDTLAQAYRIEESQDTRQSLLESAKNRWSAANNSIYARGILAAFLCDVAILRASKGKRSITEVYRAVYRKHRAPNKPEDGNRAILKILKNHSELDSVVGRYIVGAEKINLVTDLESIGIETSAAENPARFRVKDKLDGRQKDLLDKLGYNNWRKLSGERK